MTGHILARLILEAEDEPLDIEAEVKRLTGTPHPGIEIEIEGNHWNVDRRSETRGKVRQGQIFRNELEDMPREIMSPEAIAQWEAVGWIAVPLSPHIDTQFTKTFDEAVTFLANLRFVGESQDDPDNPELYTNPERVAGTPKHVLLETAFRAMLKPYYDQIDIQKKETNYYGALTEYIHWRVICKRTTGPLKLPNMPTTEWWKPVSKTNAIEWRKQVEKWFMETAHRHGLVLRNFSIYGRLRRDPYFTFETYKWKTGSVAETLDDDPESIFKDIISKIDWDKDLEQALWKFHPYGVGYSVIMSNHRQAVITVWTYFPVERRDTFAEDVKNFVVKWLTDTHVMTVKDVQMTKWETGKTGLSDKTGFVVYINCPQVADAMRTDARRTSML